MAISYVGGRVGNKVGATSGNTSVALNSGLTGGSDSAVQAGDLVIVVFATGSSTDRTLGITDPSAGAYTLIGSELYSNGTTYDTNLRVAYKFMPSTPDASVNIGPTLNASDGGAWAVYVLRGVDPTTPLDVTPTTATGTGSSRPNPPSITPVTSGAWVIFGAGGACATGTTAYTFASTTNLIQNNGADTNDGRAALATSVAGWTSGAVDPAAAGAGSNNAADSWAAVTIALRPAPEPEDPDFGVSYTTPARFTGEVAANVDITSSSFTAPAGSLLVLCVEADTYNGGVNAAVDITITVSDSGGLTWTLQAERDPGDGSGSAHASIWTAPVPTEAARTVSVRRTTVISDPPTSTISAKVYVVVGQDASPIGATSEGVSASNSIDVGVTTTASGSLLFVTCADYAAQGAPTSSDLTVDSAHYPGLLSVVSGYKVTGAAGAQTGNIDGPGAGAADWSWVALEIKAAALPAGGALPPIDYTRTAIRALIVR